MLASYLRGGFEHAQRAAPTAPSMRLYFIAMGAGHRKFAQDAHWQPGAPSPTENFLHRDLRV